MAELKVTYSIEGGVEGDVTLFDVPRDLSSVEALEAAIGFMEAIITGREDGTD